METSRKRPARGVLRFEKKPTVVFDTVCAKSRQGSMALPEIHACLIKVWREDATDWLVGRYVVMPDHIHYFAWATSNAGEFQSWVKYWKSKFTKLHSQKDLKLQADNWDTRLRSESQYEEKWEYVWQNPVRAGLVENADAWEFSGTVHDLRW